LRPFTDVLRDIRKGRVVDAATEALAEVVRAVLDTSKPGEVTLKLKITPQGKGDNAVVVSAEVKAKRPMAPLPDALFFADLDGDLLRDDPTQQRIFADAAGDKIDARTGEVLQA
jgi:recombinational DNA repair ATPase RecF